MSETGTKIVIYNLTTTEENVCELDFKTDPTDFILVSQNDAIQITSVQSIVSLKGLILVI